MHLDIFSLPNHSSVSHACEVSRGKIPWMASGKKMILYGEDGSSVLTLSIPSSPGPVDDNLLEFGGNFVGLWATLTRRWRV